MVEEEEDLIELLLRRLTQEKKKIKPTFLRVYISFLVPLSLLFPNLVSSNLTIFIALSVFLVIISLLPLFFELFFFNWGGHYKESLLLLPTFYKKLGTLGEIIVSIFILLVFVGIPLNLKCGTIFCTEIFSSRYDIKIVFATYLIFSITLTLLGIIIPSMTFWILFTFTYFLLLSIIFFLTPPVWYRVCRNIPLIYNSQFCNPYEVIITTEKEKMLTKLNGINVYIDSPQTIYAGKGYEFSFTIKNNYETPIGAYLEPGIHTDFGDLDFYSPISKNEITINSLSQYTDTYKFDPNKATVKRETCEWNATVIAEMNGFYRITNGKKEYNISKVECASDKKCDNGFCGKTSEYRCQCIDWLKATCKSSRVYSYLHIKHNGIFQAVKYLYFNLSRSVVDGEVEMGPVKVEIMLIPNPYDIGSSSSIKVFLKIKSLSGNISINSIKVKPIKTNITTIDRENEVIIFEIFKSDVSHCKTVEEAFQTSLITSGKEVGGIICELTPPTVERYVIDLNSRELLNREEIVYSKLMQTCMNFAARSSNSMLCNFELKRKKLESETEIKNILSFIKILVEIEYTRSSVYYSSTSVYRGEECKNLQ
jgi:hypothetical protein